MGYIHDIKHGGGIDVGMGAQVTVGTNPGALDPYYGSGTHTGFQIFLRLRPSRMKAEAMAGMGGM